MKNLKTAVTDGLLDGLSCKPGEMEITGALSEVIAQHVATYIKENVRLAILAQPRAETILNKLCRDLIK